MSSIRRRLQASSLLAVLVGYGVLLVANRQLATVDRVAAHREVVDQLQQKLNDGSEPLDPAAMQRRIGELVIPSVKVWLEGTRGTAAEPTTPLENTASRLARQADQPFAFMEDGRTYLTSVEPLLLSSGEARLHILEDFSDDAEREQTIQLLLIAMAGMTALLTSALLRVVMRRGLRPLDQLGSSVATISANSLGRERLLEQPQPEELQPIAQAFNELLDRLAVSFERQRAFVDGVSHELRTPMTLISGYAQRLQRQEDQGGNPSGVEVGAAGTVSALALIQNEAERMARLVSDLLDIARDDAGHLELTSQELDVEQVLLETYERLVTHSGARLKLMAPVEGEVLAAFGDADRLQQCLTNLVENALKYSTAGSPIELFATSEATGEAQPAQVVVHVRDRGPGVADTEKVRIFERFVQGSSACSGRRGSGIGLSVVKLLMERMGGSARVVNAPGGGSDFQLALRRFTPVGSPSLSMKPTPRTV